MQKQKNASQNFDTALAAAVLFAFAMGSKYPDKTVSDMAYGAIKIANTLKNIYNADVGNRC